MTRFSVTSSQGVTGKNMLMTVAEVSLTSDNWTKEDEVVMNSCCTLTETLLKAFFFVF